MISQAIPSKVSSVALISIFHTVFVFVLVLVLVLVGRITRKSPSYSKFLFTLML